MCAIYGFYSANNNKVNRVLFEVVMYQLYSLSRIRGRDAMGIGVFNEKGHTISKMPYMKHQTLREFRENFSSPEVVTAVISNCRAEPTNEWVEVMRGCDVQPYANYESDEIKGGTIFTVHNGTIANDEKFMQGKYCETSIDSQAIPLALAGGWDSFRQLTGSIASASYVTENIENGPEAHSMVLAKNYRPISLVYVPMFDGYIFASCLDHIKVALKAVPDELLYQEIEFPSNSILVLSKGNKPKIIPDIIFDDKYPVVKNNKSAVVICSGGLDSTVVARLATLTYSKIILAHFHYGCRAEDRETKAVYDIYAFLRANCPNIEIRVELFDLSFLTKLGGNSLVDTTMPIAQGKEGVEYANEWVPFRNGLMLSMITSYCDRWGIGNILMGTNLEEAGAYGDNEGEFFSLMEKAIAIGSKIAPKIICPLENYMKRDIVRVAFDIGAPIHLSWSCYDGGSLHCGTCGPCMLRRTAFAMAKKEEVIEYRNTPEVLGLNHVSTN